MKWAQGRLNRRDYIVSQLIGSFIAWPILMTEQTGSNERFILLYNFFVLIPLMILIAGITIRRLHDLNRTGWYALINLIPIVAILFQVYLMLAKSYPTENRYGKLPKTELDLVHIFFNR